jgi:hypothetical protein
VSPDVALEPDQFAIAVAQRGRLAAHHVYAIADTDAERLENEAYAADIAELTALARAQGVPEELLDEVVDAWSRGEEPFDWPVLDQPATDYARW